MAVSQRRRLQWVVASARTKCDLQTTKVYSVHLMTQRRRGCGRIDESDYQCRRKPCRMRFWEALRVAEMDIESRRMSLGSSTE